MERNNKENIHLTEAEVATLADATVLGDYSNVDNSVQRHVDECDQCAHEVAIVAQLSKEVSDGAKLHKSETSILKLVSWGVAAGFALFMAVRFFSPNGEINLFNTNRTAQIKDDELHNRQNQLLSYTPNAEIEKLVERFKGVTLRGEIITIVTPRLLEGKASDIALEWKNQGDQQLMVEIFNNVGEKVYEYENASSPLKLQKLDKLGLYYWKLINQDFDLLFCGKIIVK